MSIRSLHRKAVDLLTLHKKVLLHGVLITVILALAFTAAISSSAARQAGDRFTASFLAFLSLILAAIAGIGSIPQLLRAVFLTANFPQITFKINPSGIYYLLFVLVLSLSAMNSGNNLLFLLLAILLSIIIVSGVFSRLNLRGLRLLVSLPDSFYAGERIHLRVVIRNTKLFWNSYGVQFAGLRQCRRITMQGSSSAFSLRQWLADSVARPFPLVNQEAPITIPMISVGRMASIAWPVQFVSRGKFSFQNALLKTSFPFGFFQKGFGLRLKQEFIVFPAPSSEGRICNLLGKAEGPSPIAAKGQSGPFHSHREYGVEDGVRNVDWKASAKAGCLLLKEFYREGKLRVHLLIDTAIPGTLPEEQDRIFEQILSDAAGMAHWMHRSEASLQIFWNGNQHLNGLLPVDDSLESTLTVLALLERQPADLVTDDWFTKIKTGNRQENEIILLTARKEKVFCEGYSFWRIEYYGDTHLLD